jgi:hypothetical protein
MNKTFHNPLKSKTSKIGFFRGFFVCLTLICLLGCHGLLYKNEGVLGKASLTQAQATQAIRDINTEINKTDDDKLTHIGAWSAGVDYSLQHVTNKEPAVITAQEINQRVKDLANKPDTEELKEVYRIVDTLLTNQANGLKLLEKKDQDIIKLESHIDQLNQEKQEAIKKYVGIADANAQAADQYKATLKELDSGWGLAAVWYGLKKFIVHIAWTLGIIAVLFIVLRIFAATNPIAGSVFSIFEQIGSWAINSLKTLVPKAASISKLVSVDVSEGYKSTLHKVVDCIEVVKSNEEILRKSNPTSSIGIDDLQTELSKTLNTEDSTRIAEAKKALLWK